MAKKKVDNKVGTRIQRLRDSRGYSQEHLAHEIGMSFSNLGKIERAEVDPKTTSLYKLAKALKVNVTEFFADSSSVHEPLEKAGFATKEDVESLRRTLEAFMKRMEERFPEKPPRKSYSGKKKPRGK